MTSLAIPHQTNKVVRMNFETFETRRKQIKAYASLRGISIKDLFEEMLSEKFGSLTEQEAELTKEEKAFFKEDDAFWSQYPEYLNESLSASQLDDLMSKVKNGAKLIELLNMENMVEYD